jgi:mono/diheme cytochrome c family protein
VNYRGLRLSALAGAETGAKVVEGGVWCSRFAFVRSLPLISSADADNGRHIAETRCVACHIVTPDQRRHVADAPPFDVIARKFATSPETLAFALLDPHPRMNVPLARREAQDIAAYINTLGK